MENPNTNIFLYNGTIKKMKDVLIGDQLMGDDYTPRIVESIDKDISDLYKIKYANHKNYVVHGDHELCLKAHNNTSISKIGSKYIVKWSTNNKYHSRQFQYSTPENRKTAYNKATLYMKKIHEDIKKKYIKVSDFINQTKKWKNKHFLERKPIQFKHIDTYIDPYVLGVTLGSTIIDKTLHVNYSVLDAMENLLGYRLYIEGEDMYSYEGTMLDTYMKNKKMNFEKYIPYEYKCNSIENRQRLLSGLIDSFICKKSKYGLNIYMPNCQLKDDIIYLINSLGYVVIQKKKKICIIGRFFNLPNILKEKLNSKSKNKLLNMVIKVSKYGLGPYYSLTLDKNQCYLMDDGSLMKTSDIFYMVKIVFE